MTRHLAAAALALTLGCGDNAPTSDPPADAQADPGRVTLHRLNRTEYNNTVKDLLGVSLSPADQFPYDDIGDGFDNQAEVLSLSPLQVELYQRAAEALVTEVLRVKASSYTREYGGDAFPTGAGVGRRGTYVVLATSQDLAITQTFSDTGRYRLSVQAYGDQGGPDLVRMALTLDGKQVQTFTVPNTAAAAGVFELTLDVTAGAHKVGVAFLNDYYDAANKIDRNLAFNWVRIEGPIDLPIKNPARDRLLSCDPKVAGEVPCATQILSAFARRAFRRPVKPEEIQSYLAFLDTAKAAGDDFEQGLALALTTMLVSPHFLFRVELDAAPQSTAPHRLSDHEVASRLSYFLWSSMPDDALLAAADQGLLQSAEGLQAQITRMLADPRAAALVDSFAAQWLYQRALNDVRPAGANFPAWSDELKLAMREETRLFIGEFLRGDQPLPTLLTANFTYSNALLARHYGLSGDFTDALKRVSLDGTPRGGLLTQGSLLTVTSYPTRTSPVKRGKWALEQLLCSGPPPPPPGVEGLPEQAMPTGTLRQRLEEHRKNPVCASCHRLMDPIGFGLENFDGVGAYRTVDGPGPVDASGQLPDGTSFVGAAQMAKALSGDPRFLRCVVQKTTTYALGRAPRALDFERLDAIDQRLRGGGGRFRDLVQEIVLSDSFRSRRGEPVGGDK